MHKIADHIRAELPRVKIGAPRFWGVWSGTPWDGSFKLVGYDVNKELLRLHFHGGETLSVWSPRGLIINESTFRILDADRVRWEWFYYGRPKIASNLLFMDFLRSPEGIEATTNIDWYNPELNPNASEAAFEIL